MQAMTKGRNSNSFKPAADRTQVWVSHRRYGGGIPQEKINRIFEPFYNDQAKRNRPGLMIVQRIVRDHGGRIELESHVGKGTTFRIWLPCARKFLDCWRPAA